MSEPERNKSPAPDGAKSGARRIDDALPVDGEALPPTPAVLVNRPRISTGRYAVVRPPRDPR